VGKKKPVESGPRPQVTLDLELARKARIVAAFKDVSVPDYINNVLIPIVERDYMACIEQAAGKPKE
jgi:hypothetical protein